NWFTCALAGPKARDVLEGLVENIDVSKEALPFLGAASGRIAGMPARIFRISFSGELAYEINVPSNYGAALWAKLLDHGKEMGLSPYGTEAMGVLRVEKGFFIVGRDADGRSTPFYIGIVRMINRNKHLVGSDALQLSAFADEGRRQLIGFMAVDKSLPRPRGASLVPNTPDFEKSPPSGFVTSMVYSPHTGCYIALALLEGGRSRLGEKVIAVAPTASKHTLVEVVEPIFVDKEGVKLHA